MSNTPEQLLNVLEDSARILHKTQTNIKKCPKQRLTRAYIEARIKSVEECWTTYKGAYQELIRCVPKANKNDFPYFTNEEYFVHEDLYICIVSDLNELLSTYTPSPIQTDIHSNCPGPCQDSQVKLPRISLPTFSGIYEEWPAFQDLYLSIVHNNATLSKVQKLHYLKTSLSGEAQALLKHVQVTEVNYDEAWSMLKARFGNKRIIINSILSRLFLQKKVTTQTANNIKSLLDTTTECLNALENLSLPTTTWDSLIIYLVIQKLDLETHREWEQQAYKDNAEVLPTWEELQKFLQSKFRTLELVAPSTRDTPTTRGKECAFHSPMNETTTPINFTTTSKSKTCFMCHGDHTLCHCQGFMSLNHNERCEYVKQHNLCFNCLAPRHSARMCRLKMFCRICNKHHNTLLHSTATPMTSSNDTDISTKAYHNKVEDQDSAEPADTHVLLSSHVAATTSTALLATALVPVRDQESGQVTVLRALIDHGSEATFISERAAQLLSLKETPVNGTISGVGSTQTKVKYAAEIEILSRHDASFNLRIKTYIMPTHLITNLPSQSILINRWPHLQGLILADPSFNRPGRIDLILGVEVCAEIMRSEVIKGPPGTPCAQNTSLGWVLFGSVPNNQANENPIAMHLTLDISEMYNSMSDPYNEQVPITEELKQQEAHNETTTRQENELRITLSKKPNHPLSSKRDRRNTYMRRTYQLQERSQTAVQLHNRDERQTRYKIKKRKMYKP